MVRVFPRWRKALIVAIGTLFLSPNPLTGQEVSDSLRVVIERLQARIDSLEAVVRRLLDEGQEEEAADALAELRAAAAQAAEAGAPSPDPEIDPEFQGRQRSLQALNPEISVSVDMFGHVDKNDADADNFVAREFEFSFQSALDPFSRAKIFLAHHEEGPELFPFEEDASHAHGDEEGGSPGVAVEEGYLEWVGLPGSVSVKVGKFFQRFGTLNRWHPHALPFQSRSLPHLAFIGEEALAQTGASATWLAPFGGNAAYEATVEVTRSSNAALFGESAAPSVLGHVNAFWELGAATDLELGLSWIGGELQDEEGSLDRSLLGGEFAFTWRPPERARYRELQMRGGFMRLAGLDSHAQEEGEEEHEEEEEASSALGLWGLAELRLSPQVLVGGRIEWVENPADPGETAWMASPTLTWWQSEFVRLRLEYDLLSRSWESQDEGRLWLWITFAMGPHKHETY